MLCNITHKNFPYLFHFYLILFVFVFDLLCFLNMHSPKLGSGAGLWCAIPRRAPVDKATLLSVLQTVLLGTEGVHVCFLAALIVRCSVWAWCMDVITSLLSEKSWDLPGCWKFLDWLSVAANKHRCIFLLTLVLPEAPRLAVQLINFPLLRVDITLDSILENFYSFPLTTKYDHFCHLSGGKTPFPRGFFQNCMYLYQIWTDFWMHQIQAVLHQVWTWGLLFCCFSVQASFKEQENKAWIKISRNIWFTASSQNMQLFNSFPVLSCNTAGTGLLS